MSGLSTNESLRRLRSGNQRRSHYFSHRSAWRQNVKQCGNGRCDVADVRAVERFSMLDAPSEEHEWNLRVVIIGCAVRGAVFAAAEVDLADFLVGLHLIEFSFAEDGALVEHGDLAVARDLLQRGARVALSARREDALVAMVRCFVL